MRPASARMCKPSVDAVGVPVAGQCGLRGGTPPLLRANQLWSCRQARGGQYHVEVTPAKAIRSDFIAAGSPPPPISWLQRQPVDAIAAIDHFYVIVQTFKLALERLIRDRLFHPLFRRPLGHRFADFVKLRTSLGVSDSLVLDEREERVRVRHELLRGVDAIHRQLEIPALPQPAQPLQRPVQNAGHFRLPNLGEELFVGLAGAELAIKTTAAILAGRWTGRRCRSF